MTDPQRLEGIFLLCKHDKAAHDMTAAQKTEIETWWKEHSHAMNADKGAKKRFHFTRMFVASGIGSLVVPRRRARVVLAHIYI